MTTNEYRVPLPDTVQLIRRDPKEIAGGAAPYALYVCGDFWCTCESVQEAEKEIAGLMGRDAP